MALKKLPCESKELQKSKWKTSFGHMDREAQMKLLETINKIMEVCNLDDSRKHKSNLLNKP